MAIQVRAVFPLIAANLVAQFNALKREVALGLSFPHFDITARTSGEYDAAVATPVQVDGGDPVDLAECIVQANATKVVYGLHVADVLAHKAAPSQLITAPDADDLATLATLCDDMKAMLEAHAGDLTSHVVADDPVALALSGYVTPVDEATAIDAVSLLMNQVNLHILRGLTTPSVELVSP